MPLKLIYKRGVLKPHNTYLHNTTYGLGGWRMDKERPDNENETPLGDDALSVWHEQDPGDTASNP